MIQAAINNLHFSPIARTLNNGKTLQEHGSLHYVWPQYSYTKRYSNLINFKTSVTFSLETSTKCD